MRDGRSMPSGRSLGAAGHGVAANRMALARTIVTPRPTGPLSTAAIGQEKLDDGWGLHWFVPSLVFDEWALAVQHCWAS